MTVSNANYLKQVTLTSANQAIPTLIHVQSGEHLEVTRERDNVVAALVKDTDYTVSDVNVLTGCTVTTISQAIGDALTIRRAIPLDQTGDYENNNEFPPETVEENFDKLTQITQQLQEQIDRCIKVPPEDIGDQGQNLDLKTARAGKNWYFNGVGKLIVGDDGGSGAGAPFGASKGATVTAGGTVDVADIALPADTNAIVEVITGIDDYGYGTERRYFIANKGGTLSVENGMLAVYNNNATGADTCNPLAAVNSTNIRITLDGTGLTGSRICSMRWTVRPINKTAIPYTEL